MINFSQKVAVHSMYRANFYLLFLLGNIFYSQKLDQLEGAHYTWGTLYMKQCFTF